MHPRLDSTLGAARDAEMLDRITQFRRIADVFRSYAGDTFRIDTVHAEPGVQMPGR